MSKRTDRIVAAKARPAEETTALRERERAKPISNAARFISGPAKGRLLADVKAEQDAAKAAARELDRQQRKRV